MKCAIVSASKVAIVAFVGGTMKKSLLAIAATVAMLGSPALAADMALKAPPPPACPAVADIVRADTQVSLDAAGTHFDYREFTAGFGTTVLDSEKGWVPGVSITGSVMADTSLFGTNVCDLYGFMRYSWFNGTTNYWSAPTGPLTDGANVNEFDFRFGKGFVIAPNTMITPYIGTGARAWQRYLDGPGGYQEIYSHDYAGGGLLLQYAPTPGLVLSLNGLVGSTFNANIEGMPKPGGAAVISTRNALGSELLYMVGGSADYALTAHWHVNAEVDFTSWRYGQSAPFCAGPAFGPCTPTNALEPNSQSDIVEVRGGFGYAW